MLPFILATVPTIGAPANSAANNATPETVLVSQAVDSSSTQPRTTTPEKNSYPYVSIQAGVGFPNTFNGNVDYIGLATFQNKLSLGTGFNGELAVGYKFPKLRTDLSVGYSNLGNQLQTLTAPAPFGTESVTGIGSVNLFTIMANLYYDFKIKNKTGQLSRWSPYIGAGIGWGNLSTPNCSINGGNCPLYQGGNAGVFAYQGKLGLAYRATQSGSIFLEGGYLGTSASNVNNVSYNPLGIWRLNLGWRQRF